MDKDDAWKRFKRTVERYCERIKSGHLTIDGARRRTNDMLYGDAFLEWSDEFRAYAFKQFAQASREANGIAA